MPIKNIILLDDDNGYRDMAAEMLALEGFSVKSFESPVDALEYLRSEPVDLVISDVQMPQMNGLEFTREVMNLPSPPVMIVISAYGTIDTALEAIQAGASDFVNKSNGTRELLYTIRKTEEKVRLREENARLKEELGRLLPPPNIIAKSDEMKNILALARRVAPYEASILISGESGTGKDLLARYIHNNSPRVEFPFITVNSGAIPDTLLESELFGHKKGAFTGAYENKKGLFEEAEGGTLFLDEIGELPEQLQVKLLRALQENMIRPVGSTKEKPVNVRLVAATLHNLEDKIKTGNFREDLFYRISVFPIFIPPLKDHPEDIVPLAIHYLKLFNEELGLKIHSFTSEAELVLLRHSWPGNVREIMNILKRAMILTNSEKITGEILDELMPVDFKSDGDETDETLSIKKSSRALEERLIRKALKHTGSNRTKAAKLLEISLRSLAYKIKEYNVDL